MPIDKTKTESDSPPLPDTRTPAADAPSAGRSLSLGQHVMVKVAAGAMLRNNESGGFFEADTPTPQTVTVLLLRRLQDGDLVLC